MAYKFSAFSGMPDDLKKVVDSQAKKALKTLREEADIHEAIHSVRKRFKKQRAVWRLLRDDLGETAYKEKNVFYRDLGRLLSDLRDATAVLETVDWIEDQFDSVLQPEAFSSLRKQLKEKRASLLKEKGGRAILDQVAESIEANVEDLHAFQLSDEFENNTVKSLKRVYKRGYNAFQKCQTEPTETDMHEWRKRAKYLRYQFRLLLNIWPRILNASRKEMHELTDLLGNYQDLRVLKARLNATKGLDPLSVETLFALSDKQQSLLYQQTMILGLKLYAEKPGQFARKMSHLLQSWKREETLELA